MAPFLQCPKRRSGNVPDALLVSLDGLLTRELTLMNVDLCHVDDTGFFLRAWRIEVNLKVAVSVNSSRL